MGLFSFLKNDNREIEEAQKMADLELIAPISGKVISLEEVPDLVISEKLIGDGIAIIPEDSRIVAPCSGTIARIVASANAFSIKTVNGLEIYVCYGVGTNSFSGGGFTAKVQVGDKVTTGDTIIDIDINQVSVYLKSTITSMLVVKSSGSIAKVVSKQGSVTAGETACTFVILSDES